MRFVPYSKGLKIASFDYLFKIISYLEMVGVPLNIASCIRLRNLGVVYILASKSCCHSVDTRDAAKSADESR